MFLGTTFGVPGVCSPGSPFFSTLTTDGSVMLQSGALQIPNYLNMLESVVLQSGALQNPKITQYIAICSDPGWSPTDSKIPLYHLDKKFPRTTGFLDNWYNCRRHQVTNIGKNAIFFHFMII